MLISILYLQLICDKIRLFLFIFFRKLQVERVVAYEATTKEVTKWDPVVQEIRAVSVAMVISVCTFWDYFKVAITVLWLIHIDGVYLLRLFQSCDYCFMAHSHWRRGVRTQIRISNPMATLYYTKQIHFTQAQTRIHASYFCVRQESKSVSGNVNEPLHNKDLPLGGHIFKQILLYSFNIGFQTRWLHCTIQNKFTLHRLRLGSMLPISVYDRNPSPLHNKDLPLGGHIFKQICCIHLIFMSGDLLVGPAIVGVSRIFSFLHNYNVAFKNNFYCTLSDNCDFKFYATSLRDL